MFISQLAKLIVADLSDKMRFDMTFADCQRLICAFTARANNRIF